MEKDIKEAKEFYDAHYSDDPVVIMRDYVKYKTSKSSTNVINNDYIIVNKNTILTKIATLQTSKDNLQVDDFDGFNVISAQLAILKSLLSNSIPLIPEIEKAFDAGQYEEYKTISYDGGENYESILIKKEKQEYISNLKLDI